jgi:hypothetical protein
MELTSASERRTLPVTERVRMGNRHSGFRACRLSAMYLIAVFVCLCASNVSVEAASGRVEQTCDIKGAAHYTSKGIAFMRTQDWRDALYAFQAALDYEGKCPPGTSDGIWAYWVNVEMAAAFYNSHDYAGALKLLSQADTWYSSINLTPDSGQNKKAYSAAKQVAESIRAGIADAASRPPILVTPAAPYGHYSGSTEDSTEESLSSGTVTVTRSSCDYFIVDATGGYDVLEWYSGWTPDHGDEIVGTFETYGFRDIYDKTAAASMHVWVEDYWLSLDDAYEKLNEQCR